MKEHILEHITVQIAHLKAANRLLVLTELTSGPARTGDISERLGIEASAISHSMEWLTRMQFVEKVSGKRLAAWRVTDRVKSVQSDGDSFRILLEFPDGIRLQIIAER